MSGMSDSVSKVFILRNDCVGGISMQGFKDLNEAAAHLMRSDCFVPGWQERVDAFGPVYEHIRKYHNHDHVWAPDSCGAAVCECGARAEPWYCPDSPTHLCSYERDNDPDACDYCGYPDERK